MIDKILSQLDEDLRVEEMARGEFITHAREEYRSRIEALKIALKFIRLEHYCGEPGVECDSCETEKKIAQCWGVETKK